MPRHLPTPPGRPLDSQPGSALPGRGLAGLALILAAACVLPATADEPTPRRPWIEPLPEPRSDLATITLPSQRPARPPEAGPPTASLPPADRLPPDLLAGWTRSIQPLLINRCAAGCCHGSSQSPLPRIDRGMPAGGVSRPITLKNIESLRACIGPRPDGRDLVAVAGMPHGEGSHPADDPPLSREECRRVAAWIEAAIATTPSRGVVVASHHEPVAGQSAPSTEPLAGNRLKAMLDREANPLPLWPPPQQPQGLLLPQTPATR